MIQPVRCAKDPQDEDQAPVVESQNEDAPPCSYDNLDRVFTEGYNESPVKTYFHDATGRSADAVLPYRKPQRKIPSPAPKTQQWQIASVNPFRYCGYYYDAETGLYYVSSRYYDPETCRFINADGQINIVQGVLGVNLFTYCLNNPVNMVDKDGTMAEAAIAVSSSTFAAFTAWLSTIGGANFWNPVGWIIAGVLAAGVITWAAVSLYNTYQREHARTVSKADTKIKTTVKRSSRTRYWTATVRSGYVDIGRALTYAQAVREVQAGRSVFTVTWYEAKAVALAAGGNTGRNNKNLYPEIDKGKENTAGYYYHYHTYNRKGGHVYYLF